MSFENVFDLTGDETIFTHKGIRCMVRMGIVSINGYIELPDNHPWIPLSESRGFHPADVHGGVTFAYDNVHGFDTAHAGDTWHPDSPGAQQYREHVGDDIVVPPFSFNNRTWSWQQVTDETKYFAEQAADAIREV